MKEPNIDALVEEFTYCVQPTHCHKRLMEELKLYHIENEKFMKRWNKEAGKRARKHLLNIFHLVRERRGEISYTIYHEEAE